MSDPINPPKVESTIPATSTATTATEKSADNKEQIVKPRSRQERLASMSAMKFEPLKEAPAETSRAQPDPIAAPECRISMLDPNNAEIRYSIEIRTTDDVVVKINENVITIVGANDPNTAKTGLIGVLSWADQLANQIKAQYNSFYTKKFSNVKPAETGFEAMDPVKSLPSPPMSGTSFPQLEA